MVEKKTCVVCGREYIGRTSQVTCSRECRAIRGAEAAARRYRERRALEYREKEATPPPARSFSDIFAEQARVRREEGVYLTYGQIVERMEGR